MGITHRTSKSGISVGISHPDKGARIAKTLALPRNARKESGALKRMDDTLQSIEAKRIRATTRF
jgi:hypothetical protein